MKVVLVGPHIRAGAPDAVQLARRVISCRTMARGADIGLAVKDPESLLRVHARTDRNQNAESGSGTFADGHAAGRCSRPAGWQVVSCSAGARGQIGELLAVHLVTIATSLDQSRIEKPGAR